MLSHEVKLIFSGKKYNRRQCKAKYYAK
jgi:hypothetical protein